MTNPDFTDTSRFEPGAIAKDTEFSVGGLSIRYTVYREIATKQDWHVSLERNLFRRAGEDHLAWRPIR